MLRRGPSGRRPVTPVLDGVGRGAKWAGPARRGSASGGARWAARARRGAVGSHSARRDRGHRSATSRLRGTRARSDRRRGRVGAQRPAPGDSAPAEAAWHLSASRRRAAGARRVRLRSCARGGRCSSHHCRAIAHAWTPGTHVFLGEAVMRSLALLPPARRRAAARIPVRLPVRVDRRRHEHREEVRAGGRHCHSWTVGMEIYDGARDEPLRAFGARLPRASRRRLRRAQLLRAEAARGHVEHVVARPLVLGEPVRDASRAPSARGARAS